MTKRVHGSVRLRPTRIGFLVHAEDAASISRIMRWSTCLWGGRSNPIIPIGPYPSDWQHETKRFPRSDRVIADDYMKFFEPDVLVEAEPGLAEAIGYGALSKERYDPQLMTLDALHQAEEGRRPELKFGLPIIDVYRAIYERQQQFVLRDPRPSFIFNDTALAPIVEAVFGAFPQDKGAEYFAEFYAKVFEATPVDLAPEHWFAYFRDGATTPFLPTNYELDITPRGNRDQTFFVFDHTKPHDLIDYWNRRLFETPVYPVPLCWAANLSERITEMVTEVYRPIPGNPFGTKFISHIVFGRSMSQDAVTAFWKEHLSNCPKDSLWRAGSWHPRVPEGRGGPTCERHQVEVRKVDFDAELEDDTSVSFETLAPEFAERYGGSRNRWANVVRLHSYNLDNLALVHPSNLKDRSKPRLYRSLLERPIITREGIVLPQRHEGMKERLQLSEGDVAIINWLETIGIKASLSGAGRIAKQIITSLGGLWGVHLIADEETVRLLDRMAGQEVIRGGRGTATGKQFPGRTELVTRWKSLVDKRAKRSAVMLELEDFPKHGVLKAGLGVDCPKCQHGNWFGLDQVDYEVTCERCLRSFRFPQGGQKPEWRYRLTGPFSIPNFAEGGYAVALTIAAIVRKLHIASDTAATYSTALDLKHADWTEEIDFALWLSDRAMFGQADEPVLIFGEAKSYAQQAITEETLKGLKRVATIIPGAFLVISVMKGTFDDTEKALLSDLVRWSWETAERGPLAHVILLTGIELFAEYTVEQSWRDAGEPYAKHADFHTFSEIRQFAYATQRIHLGLDRYEAYRQVKPPPEEDKQTPPAGA